MKGRQLAEVPIFIIGKRDVHWQSFDARLADMAKRGTLKDGEVAKYITFVENPVDVIPLLQSRLRLP